MSVPLLHRRDGSTLTEPTRARPAPAAHAAPAFDRGRREGLAEPELTEEQLRIIGRRAAAQVRALLR